MFRENFFHSVSPKWFDKIKWKLASKKQYNFFEMNFVDECFIVNLSGNELRSANDNFYDEIADVL